MVNEYGASLYEIDKQPIIDATAEVFSSFGKANGLTEMIERIQALWVRWGRRYCLPPPPFFQA